VRDILAANGIKAVPALTTALRDNNEQVQKFAAEALGRIGPEAKAAIPELTEACDDPDKSVVWLPDTLW